MNRNYSKIAKNAIDDFMESLPHSKDPSVDIVLKQMLDTPWRSKVEEHLAGCIEAEFSHGERNIKDIADDVFYQFHKGFRQIDIIDRIRWTKHNDSLSINSLIWNILTSPNSTLQWHIKYAITDNYGS